MSPIIPVNSVTYQPGCSERVVAPSLGKWLLDGLPYAASGAALLVGLSRVFGALPARGALEPSLWDTAQGWVRAGYASLGTLGDQASALLVPDLLPQINPLVSFSVLALLTLALYLSLAEEH